MTLLILQRKPTPSRISLYLPMLPVRSHSFSDLVPMEPRSDLPPMTPEHPQYKYLECVSQLFQLSKRPQLKEKGDDGRPLPILYEVELNLHNRYPVWVLRVGLKREDES